MSYIVLGIWESSKENIFFETDRKLNSIFSPTALLLFTSFI